MCCVVPFRTKHIHICFGPCGFRNGVAMCFTSQLFCEMSLSCYCATFKCLYLRLLHGCDSQLFQQHLTHCLAPGLRHITPVGHADFKIPLFEFPVFKNCTNLRYVNHRKKFIVSRRKKPIKYHSFLLFLSILVRVCIVKKAPLSVAMSVCPPNSVYQ